jgi:hypothetical protein
MALQLEKQVVAQSVGSIPGVKNINRLINTLNIVNFPRLTFRNFLPHQAIMLDVINSFEVYYTDQTSHKKVNSRS